MKYFLGVKNANELKELFRKLCNNLHPDKGGKASEFIAMMDEYNSLKDSFNSEKEKQLICLKSNLNTAFSRFNQKKLNN